MSDDMRCEVCGAEGRRRAGAVCPEGWLYLEVADDDADDDAGRRGLVLVASVCSRACAGRAWREGPGRLVPGRDRALRGEAIGAPISARVAALRALCECALRVGEGDGRSAWVVDREPPVFSQARDYVERHLAVEDAVDVEPAGRSEGRRDGQADR